jgi:hypothetical protein
MNEEALRIHKQKTVLACTGKKEEPWIVEPSLITGRYLKESWRWYPVQLKGINRWKDRR